MKIPVLVFFVLAGFFASSQNANRNYDKFNVLNFGNVKDVKEYIAAINSADLENFRLQDKRSSLKFDTGFELELLSANELKKKSPDVDLSGYKKEFPANYKAPLLSVLPNGKIAALIQTSFKKAGKK